MANPTYKDVCTGRTGHAEVVQVTYDPDEVSYDKLLDVFWENHDPTTLNRQGPDVGTQYRSAIFYYTPEQKRIAEASKAQLEASGRFRRPIVTEITQASTFYPAEDYHQRYLEKRGLASCHI
jgi:peptide-methionine (S)-S-oxide reductase